MMLYKQYKLDKKDFKLGFKNNCLKNVEQIECVHVMQSLGIN